MSTPDNDTESSAPRMLLTVKAAAQLLSIGRTSMFTLIRNGAIDTVKVGHLRRVPVDALTDYIQRLAAAQRAARRLTNPTKGT